MKVLRIILASVVGYLAYAVGSMLLVSPVMEGEGAPIIALGLVGLALIGLASGWLAARTSGGNQRWAGYIVSGLIALATVANLAIGLGAEPVWYKVGTLVLTAPLSLLVCLKATGSKQAG